MIIVDEALRARADSGDPVRVGMVGAGFMGGGVANQIVNSVPGMELVAIANRHPDRARKAVRPRRARRVEVPTRPRRLHDLAHGREAMTEDPTVVCRAEGIEVIMEVTGEVEFGARVTWRRSRTGSTWW